MTVICSWQMLLFTEMDSSGMSMQILPLLTIKVNGRINLESILTESVFVVSKLLCNAQEPGKPLFLSLLLYLNSEWEREWDAETLFLDTHTETGFFVRPKARNL